LVDASQRCRHRGELLEVVAVSQVVQHESACPRIASGPSDVKSPAWIHPWTSADQRGSTRLFHRGRIKGENAPRPGAVEVRVPARYVGPIQNAADIALFIDKDVERMQIEVQQPVARWRCSAIRRRGHRRRMGKRAWRRHLGQGRVKAPASLADRSRAFRISLVEFPAGVPGSRRRSTADRLSRSTRFTTSGVATVVAAAAYAAISTSRAAFADSQQVFFGVP
jgi:hypothetical protein